MSGSPPEPLTPRGPSRKHSDARKSDSSYTLNMESAKSSLYKSRHISLQSKVDSIADTPAYMGGYSSEEQQSAPDLPNTYRSSRSRSYLIEGSWTAYDTPPEPMGPPLSPKREVIPTMAPPPIKMSTFHEIMFVGVVAVSHFCTQAGLGVVLAPLDIISGSFNVTNPGDQSWFIAGYSLTVGTFILVSGRLGDILGHKRMLAFGYAWFGVWMAFAGFSVYPGRQVFFDFCRAMSGMGPAMIMPNGLALFGRAYPPGIKKNIVFSIFGAVAPAGFVTGALFGSIFAELVWWPWAFWAFCIALWFLAVLSLLVVPKELGEKPVDPPGFDWTGSVIGVIGLVLINIAWNNGPLYGWGTPHVYFLLVIGLLCLFGFVWVERRAEFPILPMHAMNSTVNFVLACVGFGWGSFGIWVFYVFRFMATIRDHTPLSCTAQFAPAVVCGLLAAGLTGFMLTHTPVSFTMMVSMIAFCIGIIIASTMPPQQSYFAQLFISVIIMPFGMDMSFPAASVILSNHMPHEHQGLAMSLVNTVVNYSISIALGIAGTVEVNVVKHPTTPEDILRGYRSAFYTAIGLSLMGVICGALFFFRTLMKEGWKVMEH